MTLKLCKDCNRKTAIVENGMCRCMICGAITPLEASTPIEEAVNIGPTLAIELREAGIPTLEALRETGYLEAWKRIPHPDSSSCLALAGAIRGVQWKDLAPEIQAQILAETNQHQK